MLRQQQLTGFVWATVTPTQGIVTGAAGLAHAGNSQQIMGQP